jgi:hypothetical protein
LAGGQLAAAARRLTVFACVASAVARVAVAAELIERFLFPAATATLRHFPYKGTAGLGRDGNHVIAVAQLLINCSPPFTRSAREEAPPASATASGGYAS